MLCAGLNFAGAGGAQAAEWPEFHGTGRENVSRETGLLRQWPAGGPKLLWKFAECGRGYACVSIAQGLIYTSGDFDNEEMVLALDLDGKLKWKSPNGRAWKGPQQGARTTPTWSDGMVYHLNAHGLLAAFEAASGKPVWSVNLKERFEARAGGWGYAENVIVEGNLLLCTPGGTKGRIVALDKKTGKTVWANTEITDRVAYGSPIIVSHGGVRMFINFMHELVVGVDVASGKLMWSHKHESTCDQNVTSPVYSGGGVFVTSGHRGGGRKIQLDAAGRNAKEMWFSRDYDNCHGGVILHDGHLYFCGCRLYNKGLFCTDFTTGNRRYKAEEIGKVSVTSAEGFLYCLGNEGDMMLVQATPEKAEIVSTFPLPRPDKEPTLSHPVICGGRLYLRHLGELYVYDIGAKVGG